MSAMAAEQEERPQWVQRLGKMTAQDNEILLFPAAAMLILQALQSPGGTDLHRHLACVPRTVEGIKGIFLMHFCHGSWHHCQGNLCALYLMGTQLLLDGVPAFVATFAFIALVGGTMLWTFGQSSAHVGLSLVLYGFWGFVISSLPLQCPFSLRRVFTVLVVACIYGPLEFMQQATPGAEGDISWDAHLCGLVTGVIWAHLYFYQWRVGSRVCGGYRTMMCAVPLKSAAAEANVELAQV